FKVFAAGGLSTRPYYAKPVMDFIPLEDALPMCRAIVGLHREHGDRKNRARARLKFVMADWGEEKFIAELTKLFEKYRAEASPDFAERILRENEENRRREEELVRAKFPNDPPREWKDFRPLSVFRQRQSGLYGVVARVPRGETSPDQLRALARLARQYGDHCLHLTIRQNVEFHFLTAEEVRSVVDELARIGFPCDQPDGILDVVSCTGADYCRLAVTTSMSMAAHLIAEMEDFPPESPARRLRINISGCPNSCAQQQIVDIGLMGVLTKVDGEQLEAYNIFLGGDAERAFFGKLFDKKLLPEQVVAKVNALAHIYNEEAQNGECFLDYLDRVGFDPLRERISTRIAAGA
ncbi:MAG: nitrite/sulfite reductase, partial [bacterium]